MDRRKFLQLTTVTGIGLAVGCKKDSLNQIKTKRVETPTVIIGSGFGGAISALRLSLKGIKNTLIERGRSWINNDYCSFTESDKRSTWLKNNTFIPIINTSLPTERYVGVTEYHKHPNMNIFNASGLGGGSLLFGATYVKPNQSIFERTFSSEISYEEMENKYFPKVQQEIGFNGIPEDIYNSKYYLYAREFEAQVARAGWRTRRLVASYNWDIIRKELNGEIPLDFLKGEGMYGTRNGSKKALIKHISLVQLPLATPKYILNLMLLTSLSGTTRNMKLKSNTSMKQVE